MATVSMSPDLNASANEVWKRVGGYNALPDNRGRPFATHP